MLLKQEIQGPGNFSIRICNIFYRTKTMRCHYLQ